MTDKDWDEAAKLPHWIVTAGVHMTPVARTFDGLAKALAAMTMMSPDGGATLLAPNVEETGIAMVLRFPAPVVNMLALTSAIRGVAHQDYVAIVNAVNTSTMGAPKLPGGTGKHFMLKRCTKAFAAAIDHLRGAPQPTPGTAEYFAWVTPLLQELR
jgi:hypothetical protein